MPYPILTLDLPRPFEDWTTNFHHRFHPQRHPELQRGVDGGEALRNVSGQVLPVWQHQAYHDLFLGPDIPVSREAKFRTCVAACAGFVPTRAINIIPSGGYEIVDISELGVAAAVIGALTPHTRIPHYTSYLIGQVAHDKFHVHGQDHPIKYGKTRRIIGQFFATYALDQELGQISLRVIREFLGTPDRERRKELGNLILNEAIVASVEPLGPVLHGAVESGAATRRRSTDLRAVVKKFFVRREYPAYHDELERRLQTVA